MHALPRPSVIVAALVASLFVAALVAFGGMTGVLVAGGGSLLLLSLLLHKQMCSLYLNVLALLLLGYMFLSRGAAYFGVGPIYIGEIVLFAGLLLMMISMVRRTSTFGLIQSGLVWLYMLFALLGVARTLPYIDDYGLDALRDAALWYYGAFMILAIWLLDSRPRFELAVQWFSRLLPAFLLWVPIAYVVSLGLAEALPTVPGTDQPIVTFRGSEAGVFLGAVIVFLLLFDRRVTNIRYTLPATLLWMFAFVGFLVVASVSRGGFLSIIAGGALACLVRPTRRIFQGAVVAAVVLLVAFTVNVSLDLGERREVSISQLQDNVSSLFSVATGERSGDINLQGTVNYRYAFWSAIADDVFFGAQFLSGHGFGLNIASYYGYQPTEDESLRNAHNSSLTILARMGVPGFSLWVLFNAAYAFAMVRGTLRARRKRERFWEAVNLWLLAFWVMASLSSVFAPFLDSPQGGVWFWTTVGAGIAALRVQKSEAQQDPSDILTTHRGVQQ